MRARVLIAVASVLLLFGALGAPMVARPDPQERVSAARPALSAGVPHRDDVAGPTTTDPPTPPATDPPPSTTTPPSPKRKASVSATPAVNYSSMEPCGGDLPPCWVKQRESKGDYGAYNPTGCRWYSKDGALHEGCWGAWQFGSEWEGKLGLPQDLSTATPEQQDDAARQLWNGGDGCHNWAAC